MTDFDLNDLKKLGLTGSITYYFSGEGDDGYWNISEDNLSFPDNFDDKDDCYEYFGKILMDELPSGWEINYGSYGDMKIDFDQEKIYFSTYERGDLRDPEIHDWLVYVADQYDGETEFILCSTKTIYDLSWGKIDKIVEYGERPEVSVEYLADNIDLTEIDYYFEYCFSIFDVSLMKDKGINLPEECLYFDDDDLSGFDLSDTNLWGVSLSNANLSNANLSGANLKDADLSNADLSNANLSGADLTGADLTNANLEGIITDENTKIDIPEE